MSDLALKLARLRRQAGLPDFLPSEGREGLGRGEVGAGDASTLPASINELEIATAHLALRASNPLPTSPCKQGEGPERRPAIPEHIRRLLGIRTHATTRPPQRTPDRELPGVELSPGLRYRELLIDWLPAPAQIDASFARDFAHVDRDAVLAFDTETTGLAGGTGTRAFMIGAADWVVVPGSTGEAPGLTPLPQARLRVRQLFLTQMRGEAAMLEAFAGWLAPETVLVSYNGRCYDAPLLATRYRLARMPPPHAPLRHLDLLFPTRRRYRGRWENCRLATIERHVLGVLREDDLPGSEAPRAWLDWLRGGDARDFRRVLAHNDQDVRSLVRLLLRLGEDAAGDRAVAG
jgi:uncharacterized protein YprB with RNaseH-like and TPR domain